MTEHGHVPSLGLHLHPLDLIVHDERGILEVPLYCNSVPLAIIDRHIREHGDRLGTEDREAEVELAVVHEQLEEITEAFIIEVHQESTGALGFHVETHLALAAGVPHGECHPLSLGTRELQAGAGVHQGAHKESDPEQTNTRTHSQHHDEADGFKECKKKNAQSESHGSMETGFQKNTNDLGSAAEGQNWHPRHESDTVRGIRTS